MAVTAPPDAAADQQAQQIVVGQPSSWSADSKLLKANSSRPPPYEVDFLALLSRLTSEGASFGAMFHLILHNFPSIIDFRAEVPLSVHEAMLRLMTRAPWSTE